MKPRGQKLTSQSDSSRECCQLLFRKSISFHENSDISLGRKESRKIVYGIMKYYTGKTIFSKIKEHMFDSDPLENHLVLLIRAIAEKYLQVRYSYAAKHFTARPQTNSKINSCQTLTKLIQFSGQYIYIYI